MDASIPLIDLAGDSFEQRVDAIAAACRDIGFFAVVGHGVDDDLRLDMLAQARRFFALPLDRKRALAIERSAHHRGYAGIGEEQLEPGIDADVKETLDFGLERAEDDPDRSPLEGPNQWPDLPGFREVVERYQDAALETARTTLRHIAAGLGQPVAFFDDRLDRPLVGARMVHYPPVPQQVIDHQLGCGAHSDYGCLTVLSTDGTPGLQLQQLDGSWLDVLVDDGAFVINLGDLLARWTNGRYRSTKHRVISPASGHRYAVPTFVNPNYDVLVECLPSCLGPGERPQHEPVTSGGYLQSRFDDTFAYRAAD
ncbi:MAG: 2-oxoglutarate and iron-dependent oxygenase domain-containing protein [Actinomycetota bacterium]